MRGALSVLLGAALVLMPATMNAQTKKPGKAVSSLRGSLSKIRQKQDLVQRQLSQTKKAAKRVKGDLNQVNNRLEQVQVALEETTDRLDDGKREQRTLGTRLHVASRDLDKTREQVRARLRWYYVHGQESHLSLLVGAKSTGDLATWKELMERVSESDRQVFSRYRDLRDEVAGKKRRQDHLVTEIKGLADTQQRQKVHLNEVREEKAEVLSDLRRKQSELQKMLRQLAADEAAIESQIERYLRAMRASGRTTGPAPKGGWSRPCGGRLSSGFGMRFHPILRRSRLHAGVDFAAPSGTPIKAANNGVVIASQRMSGYGNVVIIDHGGGITTTYAHCSRIFVSRGQKVGRGQRIASVGATGLATGPHLHFEVRVNGKAVNPMRYI